MPEIMRKFNFSVDTAVLFAMLLSCVWFGATVRADLDNVIKTIDRNESAAAEQRAEFSTRLSAMERTESEAALERSEIASKVSTLEAKLNALEAAPR